MKKFRLGLSESEYESLKVDMGCCIDRLKMDLDMYSDSVTYYKNKRKLSKEDKEDMDALIKSLESLLQKLECWKDLPGKITRDFEIEISDFEYSEFIRCIAEEIEYGYARLDDYKGGMFSWGYKMIPYETEAIQTRECLYRELEGKDYVRVEY